MNDSKKKKIKFKIKKKYVQSFLEEKKKKLLAISKISQKA